MVLSISISADTEALLQAKAAAAGLDVETYAARQLEKLATAPRTIVEISGPVGEAFANGGMSEEALTDLLEDEKHAMRAERRSRKSQ